MNLTYLTMAIFAATTKCTAVVSASSIHTATTSLNDVSDAAWNDEVTQGDYKIDYNHRGLATVDNLAATNDPLSQATGPNIVESFINFLQELIFTSKGDYTSDAAAKTALCYTTAELTAMATASCANVTAAGGECTGTVESYSCVAQKVTRRRQLFRAAGSRDLQATTHTYEVTNDVEIQSVITIYVSGNTDPATITALEAELKGQIVASTTVATQTLTATCPTGAICAAPTITIVVANPSAKDLTRWYPQGWSEEGKFCSNDGGYATYMFKNGFLMSSLEACCKRYYGWKIEECLVAGGQPQAESGEYYVNYKTENCNQDCLKTGSSLGTACTNPGAELPQTWQTKYKDAETCCKNKLWWTHQPTCRTKSGDPTASVTYTNDWYSAKDGDDCVQDCASSNGPQCTPTEGIWETKYVTLAKCCNAKYGWLNKDSNNCQTAQNYNP